MEIKQTQKKIENFLWRENEIINRETVNSAMKFSHKKEIDYHEQFQPEATKHRISTHTVSPRQVPKVKGKEKRNGKNANVGKNS